MVDSDLANDNSQNEAVSAIPTNDGKEIPAGSGNDLIHQSILATQDKGFTKPRKPARIPLILINQKMDYMKFKGVNRNINDTDFSMECVHGESIKNFN